MQQWTRIGFMVLALPLLAACAVIVDPESLLIRCDMDLANEGRDPCQSVGQQCTNGLCRPCDPDARELCNGRDDDCDGKIDEGHDADGDGFTWCGGGRVELADCVDSDPDIHPAPIEADGTVGSAPVEACDGKDNDCDSKVDEDQCPKEKKCPETACDEDRTCDTATGVCIVPRPVGSGCTVDSDCKAGFCLRPGSFGLPIKLMDNRCASACCSNSDCDDGSSCVIARSGARACLPNNIVGRGSRKSSESCNADDECQSGLCAREVSLTDPAGPRPSACQTRCFASAACPNAECILSNGTAADPRTFWCGDPLGRIESGEWCSIIGGSILGTCRTNFCTDDSCASPCARDADCDKDAYCKLVDVRPAIVGPSSSVSICAVKPTGAAEAEGIEHLCCTNDDCGGQLCAPNSPRTNITNIWNMSCKAVEQPQ